MAVLLITQHGIKAAANLKNIIINYFCNSVDLCDYLARLQISEFLKKILKIIFQSK